MALNRTILKKLNEHTKDNEEIKKFLVSILQFESSFQGWYEKEYVSRLEEYCDKGVKR